MTAARERRAHDVEHVDRLLARLAGRQDGVVHRPQLLALGLTPAAIKHRIGTGRLIVLFRGVYAVGHAAVTARGWARAGLFAAGPTAVLSHRTAAALWGLTPSMPPFVEVTVTTRARRPRPRLKIHETTDPPETRRREGLPLTAPLRTLHDLEREPDYDKLCAEALVLRLVEDTDLPHEAVATRSELERRLFALIAKAGLPKPQVDRAVGPYRADFHWPEHKLIVETDGYAFHRSRTAFERDTAREADLVVAGQTVLRFTWRQLEKEPLRVTAQLARALATRSPRPRAPAAA